MDRSIQMLVYSYAGIELLLCVCFSILICFTGFSFVSYCQFMLLLFWLFYYHFSYFSYFYSYYYYFFLTLFIYSSFYYVVIIYIIVSLISLPFLYGRAGPPDPGRGRLAFFIRTCWSAGSRTRQTCLFCTDMLVRRIPDAIDLPFFTG